MYKYNYYTKIKIACKSNCKKSLFFLPAKIKLNRKFNISYIRCDTFMISI